MKSRFTYLTDRAVWYTNW